VLLASPRYAAPAKHWVKVKGFLSRPDPDHENAVKEAISAVEGLAKIVTGDDGATLGESIKALRRDGKLHPALAKALEGLWGFASEAPGVRHGAGKLGSARESELRFAVNTARAAACMLLDLDK
jgi:hypothetical protein